MSHASRLAMMLVVLGLVPAALAGCTGGASASAPGPAPVAIATPTPTYVAELPAWAKEGSPVWLVYPGGFECVGTEGCANDYRAIFGEPGPQLPEGVEYYDAAKHDCVVVVPLGVSC